MGYEMKTTKRLLIEVAVYVVLLLLVINLYSILSLALHTKVPLAVVTSTSMYPTLGIGDLVIIEGVKINEIKVGDIIIFKPRYYSYPIIHRVVRIIETNGKIIIKTKGDNNLSVDPWDVTEDLILGRVIEINGVPLKVPFIGYLTLYLKEMLQLFPHR